MIRTKGMGDKKPDYIKRSIFSSVIFSVVQALGSGSKMLKGGDFWQVGGEFLFVKPAAGEPEAKLWPVTWAHRMKNTRDHAEIRDIKWALGLDKGAGRTNGAGAAAVEKKPRRSSTFFGRKGKGDTAKELEQAAETSV